MAAKKVLKTPAKKAALTANPVAKRVVKPVATKAATTVPSGIAAKSAATATRKAPSKPTVNAAAKTEQKAVGAPPVKPTDAKQLKPKKPKLVRDSFTIPKLEYLSLDELKKRGGHLGHSIKKSELIRAGIKALAEMSDTNFLKALQAVPSIKTGRPAKD